MSLKENSKTYKSLPENLSAEWSEHLSALKSLKISLDYLDFLKLCSAVTDRGEREKMEEMFGFRWTTESEKLFELFCQTPLEFQNWAEEKKLAFNDLRPLLRGQIEVACPFLLHMGQLAPSKSIGCEILEKICDALDLTAEPFRKSRDISNPEAWLKELNKLSQPVTLGKDQVRNQKVQKWPWPMRTKGQWKRRGDQAGLYLEIYSLTPEEFEQKLEDLKKLSELWKREL